MGTARCQTTEWFKAPHALSFLNTTKCSQFSGAKRRSFVSPLSAPQQVAHVHIRTLLGLRLATVASKHGTFFLVHIMKVLYASFDCSLDQDVMLCT